MPGPQRAALTILALTVGQLLVGALAGGDQFAGKAFGARLALYPLMMLAVPVAWWLTRARRGDDGPPPWGAFALVMAPFLVDVTGNTLDLYDTVAWWDDANHLGNWLLLNAGLGLLLARGWTGPRWTLVLTITGTGALLAVAWELGEYVAFIRNGTELATAYEDTLGDEALGTLGALVAGLLVSARARS